MHNESIHITRIKRLLEREKENLTGNKASLEAEFCLDGGIFKLIKPGEAWAQPWQRATFRLQGSIPENYAGQNYALCFDCDGEACLLLDGMPHQGLTPKVDWYHNAAKRLIPLNQLFAPGESFELLLQASANGLFGAGKEEFHLRECSLVTINEELFQTTLDMGLLLDLAEALPQGNVRRQTILFGLDQVCNVWNSDRERVRTILTDLLGRTANASALTAFSVGHAHLDLAWLWPLAETRRKGARTFANALRLLEQYPDYIFGASQAQLYQWIKEEHPGLWDELKSRVEQGRWEIQGASWVEFDTNLISAESIIRQFMYGKRFFLKEFGYAPRVLWLPDCFGFSGNLPQFLKGCQVDWFITQKLSWNESNTFPHHLFQWEGIDGSRITAHQLPTNDYNFSNNPRAFLETETRYAQSELCDAFLNLYGIGDGGGGPTRNHIEYGLRQRNLEGVCKFRFARSTDFFEHISTLDKDLLPVAYGELYLEFHRGTYTTQARMKQNNRASERKLQASEYLAVLAGLREYPEILRNAWQDTLLLQFHDILPGSSIGVVYSEADTLSQDIHKRLDAFMADTAKSLCGKEHRERKESWLVINPCNQDLEEWRQLQLPQSGGFPVDNHGSPLTHQIEGDSVLVEIQIPAWGCAEIHFTEKPSLPTLQPQPASLVLENLFLRVEITPQGGIASIRSEETEYLTRESNQLLLWEDEPNNWVAWDINHFYRGTRPQSPHNIEIELESSITLPGCFSRVVQNMRIGSSTLRQSIELRWNEPFIRITHTIHWQERHKMLRAHFHPDVFSGTATYGIQNGAIQRSCKPKNAWEEAQFEVPAQRFADLSQPDRGCALLCDVKYGYRIRDSEMEITLLRSPADVDPTADIGFHSYSYALYPHAGDFAHSEVFAMAEKLAHRLIVLPAEQAVELLPEPPFRLDADNVNLDTIKPAERGAGIVLRLHEYRGQSGLALLHCKGSGLLAWECDMLEEPLPDSPAQESFPLRLSFRPFETKTILLREDR